jgi:hypothetical protein
VGSGLSRSFVSRMLVVVSVIAASGCATAGSEAAHGLGAGQWQVRMPTSPSPIQELAYGHGGSATAVLDDALADLDAIAPAQQPMAAAKAHPKPVPSRVALAPSIVQPTAASAEPAPVAAAPQAVREPELLASNDLDSRYAQRETQASEQQKFRGGDAIVISAGAIVVVLLIVILILLLR